MSVHLSAFDVLGREVRVLASGEHAAGEHKAVFDASGLASGLYIIQLEAEEGAILKTSVLLSK